MCLLILLSLGLGGCFEAEVPANIVATVNGRPIVLKTVQAMQEADMSDLGIFEQFTLHELRAQYGKAIANLIVYELMLQDLESKGILITKEMIDAFEQNVRSDYPDGEFENYFEENAINLDAWREILRYIIALQHFTKEFLRKGFVAPVDEVRSYYEQNKASFTLDENYLLYEAISAKKENLAKIKTLEDLLAKKAILSPYKMRIDKANMPKEWQKRVFKLKENACTEVFSQDKEFIILCLEKHELKKTLSESQAYIYIEEFLAEEYMIDFFESWLKTKLETAEIEVSRHVINELYR